ncbi:MAG: SDR family oxidoreductase [Candidatus Diapherotrites archaeon]|nr:SDR family oxidoreductase [Candidatus Diapherotrites archaeon]
MSSVLVVGRGFLGEKLLTVFSAEGFETHCASIGTESEFALDIADRKRVFSCLERFAPETVFLCASLTNVDACEADPAKAAGVNVLGAKNVLDACIEFNARPVFFSTDFVFDGEKGDYRENDLPNPLNVYGKTKLEAERLFLKRADALVLRISSLYGRNSENDKQTFLNWVLGSLSAGKSVPVFTDQKTSPALIDDIAGACLKLLDRDAHGLFHCTGSEAVSRFGFAEKAAEVFGLDKSLLRSVSSDEVWQAAKRPRDSSLCIKKLEGKGVAMSDVSQGLEKVKRGFA